MAFAVPKKLLTRREFLAGAATAGVLAYAGTHARHELDIRRIPLALRDLPDAFTGLRIAQISDIHLVEYSEAWFLERVVAEVNALAPDIVLLTGDFVSRGPLKDNVAYSAAGLCAEILTGLHAPERYAILGNHDVAVGSKRVISPLVDHGTPVLVDQYLKIERGSDHLWLAGCRDAGTDRPDLNRALPAAPDAPVIFLCHEPDFADHLIQHPRFPGVDLMLSGHSHGGQFRLPLIGPLVLPPMGRKYIEGLFHFGHMQLYVNRGIGTTGLPFRLNCPPEITLFTLAQRGTV